MEESQLIQFNLNIHCHPSIKSDMRQHSKYLQCFYQLLLWYFEILWVVWDIVIRAKYYKICKRNWKGISKLLSKYQILERLNLVHRDIPKMGRWRLPASDWDKFLNYNWIFFANMYLSEPLVLCFWQQCWKWFIGWGKICSFPRIYRAGREDLPLGLQTDLVKREQAMLWVVYSCTVRGFELMLHS